MVNEKVGYLDEWIAQLRSDFRRETARENDLTARKQYTPNTKRRRKSKETEAAEVDSEVAEEDSADVSDYDICA